MPICWFGHKAVLRRAWLILIFLFPACQAPPIKAPVGNHSERPVRTPAYHRVRTGDTLYSVAFMYGYSVAEVAAWNELRTPYTIFKGQQLRLKPPAQARTRSTARTSKPTLEPSRPKPRRTATTAAPPDVPAPPAVRKSRPKRAVPAPPAVRKSSPKPAGKPAGAAYHQQLTWSWPLAGRLIQRYDPNSSGKKGINIAGKSGEAVRAAAAGKVVYSGSGLSGYGRLIILKHNEEFLSAYAHNRKLVAREGQWVAKGEVIAQVGSSGTDRPQLHFEIRKHGRPVDPLRHLPRR